MIITIAGMPGSGKSTIAKMLAKKLGFTHHSSGDLQREYAKEKGLTIEALGKLEAEDDTIDQEIDARASTLAEKEDDFVMDGWITFHFIPQSFKVFLECDIQVGAQRIYTDTVTNKRDSSERKFTSLAEAKKITQERMRINRERWMRYYGTGADFLDKSNFDLVIDTSHISQEETVDRIITVIKK